MAYIHNIHGGTEHPTMIFNCAVSSIKMGLHFKIHCAMCVNMAFHSLLIRYGNKVHEVADQL